MTIVEFFDKTSVENICACLVSVPERVILLGDKMSLLQTHARRYQAVLASRGQHVEFLCKTVNRNNLQSIVEVLSDIAERYDPCIFDLTGGEELCLVAAGIVCERYRDKQICLQRINLHSNWISDCGKDGKTVFRKKLPALSAEENIRIYGGKIVYDEQKPGSTHRWRFDEEFQRDIDTVWEICRADVRLWNVQIGILQAAEKCGSVSSDGLTTTAAASSMRDSLKRFRSKVAFKQPVIGKLLEEGLLTVCENDGNTVRIAYKNEQIKRCLTKAGQALEMKMFSTAHTLRDEKGRKIYNDVMHGVRIDWDGVIHVGDGVLDTENEVDVLLMHGALPVFVSCKNGNVNVDELYKLEAVAERFGGRYAKKVLVATALEAGNRNAEYIRRRAKDMQIRLVEGIQQMDKDELEKTIGNLYRS